MSLFLCPLCILQEVWTLCRIFKRIPSCKKYTPNLKNPAAVTKPNEIDFSSSNSSLDSDVNCKPYLTFMPQIERKQVDDRKHLILNQIAQVPSSVSYPSFWNQNVVEDVFASENWDDLRSVVQFDINPSTVNDCTETCLPPHFS